MLWVLEIAKEVRDQMVPACHRARRLWMTKGAEDDVSLCASTDSFAPGWRKVRITIRCVHMLPDPRVTIAEFWPFRGLGWKTLTSPGRVQMTTLASACQSNSGSPNDEVRITRRCLCLLPDSWVMIAKGGVVDKSEAFAPTYPPFVMRNSDLRSSW